MKKIIRDYEMIPQWYGIAWYNFATKESICYPIPLNLIFCLNHHLRWWCKSKFFMMIEKLSGKRRKWDE